MRTMLAIMNEHKVVRHLKCAVWRETNSVTIHHLCLKAWQRIIWEAARLDFHEYHHVMMRGVLGRPSYQGLKIKQVNISAVVRSLNACVRACACNLYEQAGVFVCLLIKLSIYQEVKQT